MRKGDKGMKVLGVILILAIKTEVGNPGSEELAEALDAVTDDTANIEFADQSAELGPYVSSPNLGEQAASLAEAVVGAPYLWGGKGLLLQEQ
jgi:hypothetical protein